MNHKPKPLLNSEPWSPTPYTLQAAALGQEFGGELGNVCEQGIHEPKEFGPNEQVLEFQI